MTKVGHALWRTAKNWERSALETWTFLETSSSCRDCRNLVSALMEEPIVRGAEEMRKRGGKGKGESDWPTAGQGLTVVPRRATVPKGVETAEEKKKAEGCQEEKKGSTKICGRHERARPEEARRRDSGGQKPEGPNGEWEARAWGPNGEGVDEGATESRGARTEETHTCPAAE